MGNTRNDIQTMPNVYGEIVLLFDKDFSMHQVDLLIGASATESLRKSETLLNPITAQHNPGYWIYRTKNFSTYTIKPILDEMQKFILEHSLERVKQLLSASSLILRIRILVQNEDDYPSIRFTPEFLQLCSEWNATIDVDVDNNHPQS